MSSLEHSRRTVGHKALRAPGMRGRPVSCGSVTALPGLGTGWGGVQGVPEVQGGRPATAPVFVPSTPGGVCSAAVPCRKPGN